MEVERKAVVERDKSYAPLETEFINLLGANFSPGLTDAQVNSLRMMYFAGAARSYELCQYREVELHTLREELLDYADAKDRELGVRLRNAGNCP